MEQEPREPCLSSLCTIITTTSPTPVNPSTELICSTLDSLAENAPDLLLCRHIIVCDGYRSGSDSKFRSGVVTPERAYAYEQYMDALELLAHKGQETSVGHAENQTPSVWKNVEIVRLAERQGFGFAVKAALELVTTPFVCVMQHDRTFMRPFRDALVLLKAMMQESRLKMVGLPTTTNDPTKYMTQAVTKLGEIKVYLPCSFDELVISVPDVGAEHLRFIPMIMWHDSTHFASSEYYRSFVFGRRRRLVTKGGFIEDKLGQEQGLDLRKEGWDAHERYGTFLLDDGAPAPARMVGHLDGKKYIRVEAKMALAESARASGAKAKAEKAARPVEEEDEADEGRVVGALGGCVAPMPKGSYLLAPKTPRSRRPPRQDRQGTEEVPIQTSS
ncbi:unnamed protein product [Durusdinium trenchii]|uniref:Uncharacterized protein n=2 Tax=Durusdinium trenchii TaxID=1381693 RepID=A0ABP0I6Z7_9DINO